jgi:hypothetical protein
MKRPVAPRIAGLAVVYFGVFSFLVALQFGSQRAFSIQAGSMTVSGYYGETSRNGGAEEYPAEFLPEGGLKIVFGGMEFHIAAPGGNFAFLRSGGEAEHPAIQSLAVKDERAVIRFAPDGDSPPSELVFESQFSSDNPELRITASFGGGYTGLEIPFRPLRNTRLEYTENGELTVAFEGVNFGFAGPRLDRPRGVLIMTGESPAATYLVVSGGEGFSPGDYALAAARTVNQYTERVSQWRDMVFTAWNRTPTTLLDNEELINAYLTDSVRRGGYQEVVSRIPRSFLDSSRQTYLSSPFLDNLAQVSLSLSAEESRRVSWFTEWAGDDPAEFFAEPHILAANAVRDNDAVVDRGVGLLSGLESPALNLVPAILEACVDLAAYRSGDDSLAFLIEPSLALIAESLRKDAANELVFVFAESDGALMADTEFNIRLGAALDQYGRQTGRENWAAVGRSLILSAFAQTDTVGMVPSTFTLDAGGAFTAVRESRFSAARLYRYLRFDYYPHAERIAAGAWMWTAASSVNVTQNAGITDIAVTFPAGETHYIILRGIRPFTRIQLHGIDYRTDPRFERYDSSGWYYINSERTLLFKIKQRDTVEHIVIHDTAPSSPPPDVPAPPPLSSESAAGNTVPAAE